MARWLGVEEVAAKAGVEASDVPRLVGDGRLVPPNDFVGGDTDAPAWDGERNLVHDPGAATRSRTGHLDELFDEVCYYTWVNGTARIPQAAVGRTIGGKTYPVGQRVSALRAQYSMGRLDATETMRFQRLPGWAWDYWDAEYRERFADVLSRSKNLTKSDRAWLATQRRRKEFLRKQRPGWVELLEKHPELDPSPTNSRVEAFAEAVERWLKTQPEGTTTRDLRYKTTVRVEQEIRPIGKQATYYRRRYALLEGKTPLTDEEVERIERLPEWSWEIDADRSARARSALSKG